MAPYARAADRRAALGERTAGQTCRSAEICRRCRRLWRTRTECSGGGRELGRALARIPCPMFPKSECCGVFWSFWKRQATAKAKANEAFVANELVRVAANSSIGSRPALSPKNSAEAVVIDERRNLVVAAAGSGKTSVIVAKAGWLIRKGYRKPSELLLLGLRARCP